MKKFIKILVAVSLAVCLSAVPLISVSAAPNSASFLIEARSGRVLSEENADTSLPAAGLVKLMTWLLFFEAIETKAVTEQDIVHISKVATKASGTRAFLDADTKYPLGVLLFASIMLSANDATLAIAEQIAGSEAEFVNRMNARAKELSLSAEFVDCTGIKSTKMTGRDVGTLASLVAKYPAFFKSSSVYMDTFEHVSGRETEMVNTNRLVREEYDGMTTSSSKDAGYLAVASKKSGAARFIAVVMGGGNSDERFKLARELMGFAISNFQVKQVARQAAKYGTVMVGNREIDVFVGEDLIVLTKKGEGEVRTEAVFEENITAPLSSGTAVGTLTATTTDGNAVSVGLVLNEDVVESTFSGSIHKIAGKWIVGNDPRVVP